jgi:arylsulfatase
MLPPREPAAAKAAAAGPAAALAAALLLTATVAGCRGPQPDAERPDFVLVVVDTLRADHLGCYGYSRPTSPRIDALAEHGTVFEAAWAAAPWTLPSIMSIMTSQYPSAHRVENDGLRLSAGTETLASRLKAAGYATGGFVSHVYASASFGFDRGFDRFEDFGLSRPGYVLEKGMEPTADKVTDSALAWLREQRGKPVFLFLHYFDPHWPYAPPERFRAMFPTPPRDDKEAAYDAISRYLDPLVPIPEDYRRFLIDRYDGEIRFVDEQVGRLLDGIDEAGRGSRRFVVLTADHGEEFKDHGSMGHGRELYEEVVRVPLLIAGPGPRMTARVALPVSGIDMAPTLLDLAGQGANVAGLHGKSLRGLLRPGAAAADPGTPASGAAAAAAGTPAPNRPLLSETVRLNAFRKAVRSAGWKLIHFMDENRSALFDLASDPGERKDLAEDRLEERRLLMQAMFSEADLLSGGWNLRWASDGRPRRFSGRVTTTGIFRSMVPLFRERGKYVLRQPDTLEFSDDGQAGWSGLTFTTTPYEAPVTFYLEVDGRPATGQVALGGLSAHPSSIPFTLEGNPGADAAFQPPERGATPGGLFSLWRTRPATSDQPISLDEETRERLRSLGYVN